MWKLPLRTYHQMTKMTYKFQNLSKIVHPGWLLHISLYLQKNSIFGIKSASLHKISLFAVNDLLFYLFELHIFPSPANNVLHQIYSKCEVCLCPSLHWNIEIRWITNGHVHSSFSFIVVMWQKPASDGLHLLRNNIEYIFLDWFDKMFWQKDCFRI